MSEAVRLLIWDMDETFWKGTLAEEGIIAGSDSSEIVVSLTERGIMNSICSKNDFESVKTQLEAMGVWDHFVFPSIDWSSKGKRVAEIIQKMQLRPEAVMFIDDNATNREEVRQACPGIQVEDEHFIAQILESDLFKGKDDKEKTRLKQYKLQEQKYADREGNGDAALDDYEFLRKSNIQVEIIYDLTDHKERVAELLNRTNQLNFTKKRLSENKAEALYDVERMIEHTGTFNHMAVVRVRDNYGDYGIVGFFHVVQNATDNFLVHFCFSCRTLGMHIETWVYRYLGKPYLEVQGEVANDPTTDTAPVDWVQLTSFDSDGEAVPLEQADYPILMGGGCDVDSIRHYLKDCSSDITVFTNTVRHGFLIRRDHSSMVRISVEDCEQEKTTLRQCGYQVEDFFPSLKPLGDAAWGLVVFSFWADAGFQIYRLPDSEHTATYCPPQVAYGNFQEFYEDDFLRMGGPRSELRHYRFAKANLRPLGVIDEERHKENLRAILRKVPAHCDVVLFTLPSKVPDLYPGSGILERHNTVAFWQYEVSEEFPNVRCVNFDQFIQSPEDAHTYDHFGRVVYLRAGQYLKDLYQKKLRELHETSASEQDEGPSSVKENDVSPGDLAVQ